ncbi:MAG: M20/M25/M40 family metallo-hydrolase [Actinobacteria bacterium]|nr:M20/M25/M40 family metallo-hydrolase [Actinomycetota bacterium]
MVVKDRIVRIFENLVSIYSPSYKERAIANHIAGYVDALGFLTYEDNAGEAINGTAGNIHVTISGNADGPCILFAAHMDTVEPSEGAEMVVKDGIIRSKGATILGADDKAGIAAMLELATILSSTAIPHGPIHLTFTVAEEVGLKGAKQLDLNDKCIDFAYVLDADGRVGKINISAPFQDSFEVEYTGRAAHAGVAPEMGINAIVAASKAISCMKLGRIDGETTANVGKIEGGRASNIVPERARFLAEARSINLDKLEAQSKHMIECFKAGTNETGAKVDFKHYRSYEGYSLTENDPIVQKAVEALLRLGIKPVLTQTGGGSDTNVFNAKGLRAVNLSMGAEQVHAEDEYVSVSELVNAAKLLVELVRV